MIRITLQRFPTSAETISMTLNPTARKHLWSLWKHSKMRKKCKLNLANKRGESLIFSFLKKKKLILENEQGVHKSRKLTFTNTSNVFVPTTNNSFSPTLPPLSS